MLTTRLAHILATGRARPWELLAVTFTNKAAREMRARIADLIGRPAEGLRWLGTFHSIAAQILRRHAELVGLKSNYTIIDADDQERLIKQLLEAENIDAKRWTPAPLGRPDRPLEEPRLDAGQAAAGRGRALRQQPRRQRSTRLYQERLRVLNACDFGDLLLHNLTIFTGHPDVLADYHHRFRYILVDEYQDTNVAQYLWLRLLAQGRQQPLLRRRRRPVDLRLARRRGGQHPALRARLSGRQGGPAGAQLPLDRPHPGRRLGPDRRQQGPARQDAVDRGRGRPEGRRCAASGTARPRAG